MNTSIGLDQVARLVARQGGRGNSCYSKWWWGIASTWTAPRQLGWRPGSVATILVGGWPSWCLFGEKDWDGDFSNSKSSISLLTNHLVVILAPQRGGGGTMDCHPMLTKNANFVTNALRGDLATVNWCGHHTCNLHQWIGNWILPKFYPRMSSLALLEPEIPYPLDVTGKNNIDVFFGVDGGCCCLSF